MMTRHPKRPFEGPEDGYLRARLNDAGPGTSFLNRLLKAMEEANILVTGEGGVFPKRVYPRPASFAAELCRIAHREQGITFEDMTKLPLAKWYLRNKIEPASHSTTLWFEKSGRTLFVGVEDQSKGTVCVIFTLDAECLRKRRTP